MPCGTKRFLLAKIFNQSGPTSDQAVKLSLTVTGPRNTQYVPYKKKQITIKHMWHHVIHDFTTNIKKQDEIIRRNKNNTEIMPVVE